MTFSRLAVAVALLMPVCAAFAAGRTAGGSAAAGVNADVRLYGIPTLPPVAAKEVSVKGVSAGVAPSLPEVPDPVIPYTQIPFYLINVGTLEPERAPEADRIAVDESLFEAQQ